MPPGPWMGIHSLCGLHSHFQLQVSVPASPRVGRRLKAAHSFPSVPLAFAWCTWQLTGTSAQFSFLAPESSSSLLLHHFFVPCPYFPLNNLNHRQCLSFYFHTDQWDNSGNSTFSRGSRQFRFPQTPALPQPQVSLGLQANFHLS